MADAVELRVVLTEDGSVSAAQQAPATTSTAAAPTPAGMSWGSNPSYAGLPPTSAQAGGQHEAPATASVLTTATFQIQSAVINVAGAGKGFTPAVATGTSKPTRAGGGWSDMSKAGKATFDSIKGKEKIAAGMSEAGEAQKLSMATAGNWREVGDSGAKYDAAQAAKAVAEAGGKPQPSKTVAALQRAGTVAQTGGKVAQAAVAGNAMLALTGAVGAAANGLALLGPAGIAAGAALGTVGIAAAAFVGTVNAIVERGAELAKFSGEITQARAIANNRQMQGDMREARELGPGIARVTDASSQLWDEIREFMLPIKKMIVEVMAAILEDLKETLAAWRPQITAMVTTLLAILEAMGRIAQLDVDGAIGVMNKLPERIATAITDAEKRRKQGQSFHPLEILEKLRNQVVPNMNAVPAGPANMPMPAFAGANFGGGRDTIFDGAGGDF